MVLEYAFIKLVPKIPDVGTSLTEEMHCTIRDIKHNFDHSGTNVTNATYFKD